MRRRTSSGCPLAKLTHLDTAAKRSVRADAMLACGETKTPCAMSQEKEKEVNSL